MRDNWKRFLNCNIDILGLNPGSVSSHNGFRTKCELPFRLLADKGKEVASLYGADGLMVKRTVYGVDLFGRIAYAARGMPTPDEIITALNTT